MLKLILLILLLSLLPEGQGPDAFPARPSIQSAYNVGPLAMIFEEKLLQGGDQKKRCAGSFLTHEPYNLYRMVVQSSGKNMPSSLSRDLIGSCADLKLKELSTLIQVPESYKINPVRSDTTPDKTSIDTVITPDSMAFYLGNIAFIQFAAFGSEEKAIEYESKLRLKYEGVYVLREFSEEHNIDLYKVVLGPVDESAQISITRRLKKDSIKYWIKELGRL